jgi:hypothetical protein
MSQDDVPSLIDKLCNAAGARLRIGKLFLDRAALARPYERMSANRYESAS